MPDLHHLLHHSTSPKAAHAIQAVTAALLDVLHNDEDTDQRIAAAQALQQFPQGVTAAQLLPALDDESSTVRLTVAKLLRHMPEEPVLDAFATHLDDSDPMVRQEVLEALVEHGADSVTAVNNLLHLLADINPAVRMSAAQALGRTSNSVAVEPLISHLNDPDSRVSLAAATALGELDAQTATQPLFDLVADEMTYYRLRRTALQALAHINPPQLDTLLFTLLNEHDLELRRMVIETVQHIATAEQVHLLLDAADWHRSLVRPVAEALMRCGGDAVQSVMIEALEHVRAWVRALAVEVLGELGSAAAINKIILLLADDTQQIRVLAANALGQIGAERAVPTLKAALADSDWLVQAAASSALARIDTPEARAASTDWRQAQRNTSAPLDLSGSTPADVDLSDIL